MLTHKLQITRQHVSTFPLNMRWNQILLQVTRNKNLLQGMIGFGRATLADTLRIKRGSFRPWLCQASSLKTDDLTMNIIKWLDRKLDIELKPLLTLWEFIHFNSHWTLTTYSYKILIYHALKIPCNWLNLYFTNT